MKKRNVQRKDKPKLIYMILYICILIPVAIFIAAKGEGIFSNLLYKPRVKVGTPAPTFTFPGLDGKMVSLEDFKGKVVFVNIWATWCPPCREEMPSIENLYQKLKGENFEILAVSIDTAGAKAVAPFMKEHKLSFPALLDTEGTIQDLYGTTGVPESFIVDKEGTIQKVIIGPIDWSTDEVLGYFRDLIHRVD